VNEDRQAVSDKTGAACFVFPGTPAPEEGRPAGLQAGKGRAGQLLLWKQCFIVAAGEYCKSVLRRLLATSDG
jgi:hypothetical protein